MRVPAPLDRLARPEYTGGNRCLPCTVVNLAIVAVGGALIARWRRAAGLLAVTVGFALIAIRGYLIPGTPRFAPRLVAPLPIDFGHSEAPRDTLADGDESPDALADDVDPKGVLTALIEAGVIETAGEDLYLDETFREQWRDRMASLRAVDEGEFLDRITDACPGDVDGQRYADRIILAGDREVRTSQVIAIAETAAIETLRGWDVPEDLQARAAAPLRNFLNQCPACGGPLQETTRQNCCGGPGSLYATPEQPVLACEECESVVVDL